MKNILAKIIGQVVRKSKEIISSFPLDVFLTEPPLSNFLLQDENGPSIGSNGDWSKALEFYKNFSKPYTRFCSQRKKEKTEFLLKQMFKKL